MILPPDPTMSAHFEHELDGLRQRLVTMASLAAQSVRQALQAMEIRDDDLARQVRHEDEPIDALEMELGEAAIRLLSMAPLAGELRLIIVAMKISHDLERVGDEATAIAKRVLELNTEPPLVPPPALASLGAQAVAMLDDAITSFVAQNPAQARSLIPRDRDIDALNRHIHQELVALMTRDPACIGRALNLMAISKRIERIADHATNIAEEVVYLHEARDIRHVGKDNAVTAPGKRV